MATYYLDLLGGDDNNNGLTFANRWRTLNGGPTNARVGGGDTIRVMKSNDPVSTGVNATFTKGSHTVTLATALTENITTCEVAWTGTTYCTTSTVGQNKEGSYAAKFAVTSGHTGGKAAYLEFDPILDLSAYSKISFWLKVSTAVAANKIIIKLCDDAVGDSALKTFVVSSVRPSNQQWMPFTFDVSTTIEGGTYLPSNVKSIALYTNGSVGDVDITFDNILACNNLHLTTLLGTDSSSTSQTFFPIRSINGTVVKIESNWDYDINTTPKGYHTNTTTAPLYVRDTIRIEDSINIYYNNTSATTPIKFEFGYDQTNMSTQNGMTYMMFDGPASANFGPYPFADVNKAGFTYMTPSNIGYQGGTITYCHFSGSTFGLYLNDNAALISSTCISNYFGCYISTDNVYIKDVFSHSNQYVGFYFQYGGNSYSLFNVINAQAWNNDYGVFANGGTYQSIVTRDNIYGFYGQTSTEIYELYCNSNNINIQAVKPTKVHNLYTVNTGNYDAGGTCWIGNYNNTNSGLIKQNTINEWIIDKVTTPVHGTAPISLRHAPIPYKNPNFRLTQRSQPFAVKANALVTCKVWVRRTTSNVYAQIRVPRELSIGVTTEPLSVITAAINTWQELTITFTPTSAGVAMLLFESYNDSNAFTGFVYFSDATITQA